MVAYRKKMKNSRSIRAKFVELWPYYILQSALAAVAFSVLLLVIEKERMVAVSAMAATCFIVFAMPQTPSAQTKNVLGGHLIGLLCGAAFYAFIPLPYYVEYPLVVAVAIFLMVVLDFEHPPAAGTALAVAINEVSRELFVIILISALVLSQIRYYSRKHLRDLV